MFLLDFGREVHFFHAMPVHARCGVHSIRGEVVCLKSSLPGIGFSTVLVLVYEMNI